MTIAKWLKGAFLSLSFLGSLGIEAFEFKPGNHLYFGPEIYRVSRLREGGTKQHGMLYGIRGGYEHLRRYTIYAGFDGLYSKGTLNGHSRSDDKIKSRMTDKNIECRFGYTFQSKEGYRLGLTPFIGYGHFWEINRFIHPSPILVKFHNHFSYVPLGVILQGQPNSCLTVQLRCKARFILKGFVKVHDKDPDIGHFKMHYEEKLQYRLDLPIIYRPLGCPPMWFAAAVPFYEYRHYGRRAGFPFDFLDTKMKICGVNLLLLYEF